MLTDEDVADALRLKKANQVMRLVLRGELPPPLVFGNQRRWLKQDLAAWLKVAAKDRWAMGLEESAPVPLRKPDRVPPCLEFMAADLQMECYTTGIYFLFMGDNIQYLGISLKPMKRVNAHRNGDGTTEKKDFDTVFYYPCPIGELFEKEKVLVAMLDPPLNIALRRKGSHGGEKNAEGANVGE